MEKEYQRIDSALEKYEKGELKILATYAEIREAENILLKAAGNDKVVKQLIRLLSKTARLRVREIKFKKING